MSQRSRRNRRRAQGQQQPRPNNAPASNNGPADTTDRYAKYLPTWMKENGGAPPPRPRVRRARPQRPAGGYTPGKFALTDPLQ